MKSHGMREIPTGRFRQRPPARSLPQIYGVQEIVPAGLWGQMAYPFRRAESVAVPET